MLIVILGPDGCGKTTIAEALVSQHKSIGFSKGTHHATNFGYLPTFSQIKSKIYGLFKKAYTNKHQHTEGEYLAGMRHKPNSIFKSTILCVWYGVDYFLGFRYLKKAREQEELVVFARYFYDFYYQRVHINLPHFIISVVEVIVPKPDLIIFLKRDPSAIFSIKPELSELEIERQNVSIDESLNNNSQFITINVEEDVQATLNQVLLKVRECHAV